jgi:adenosylcobyric acid synthase
MVQGTSSWAGKSLLATALCRYYLRRGLRVAPFKAQNMSNNARVVAGGEIGAAQYFQALAAGVEPDTRMNPVLVKPEADTRSQVILNGSADRELSEMPWRERAPRLWPAIADALASLQHEFELLVIEGAGSPAEINLADCDLTNMRTAQAADAQVLLVCDIDRGGAFAHLYGTWALLPEQQRSRLQGFVLNKFRGDPDLLAPGPERLKQLTGVPTIGVLPWLEHALPDEDGVSARPASGGRPRVAVVRYPRASNLDEFRALEGVADVVWARTSGDLTGADLLVLPGSKHVAADLAWLHELGLDQAIAQRVREGGRVLGICGGLQLLGERLEDPAGVDGAGDALSLLPLVTTFSASKLTRRIGARFGELDEPWAALSGCAFDGYEIRHGTTRPTAAVQEAIAGGLGFVRGPLLGISVHGLFEDERLVEALLGSGGASSLDVVFDGLADAVERHLDTACLEGLATVA